MIMPVLQNRCQFLDKKVMISYRLELSQDKRVMTSYRLELSQDKRVMNSYHIELSLNMNVTIWYIVPKESVILHFQRTLGRKVMPFYYEFSLDKKVMVSCLCKISLR